MNVHRCKSNDCPYFGRPTPTSCKCHITMEQMLAVQYGMMREALQRISIGATGYLDRDSELALIASRTLELVDAL